MKQIVKKLDEWYLYVKNFQEFYTVAAVLIGLQVFFYWLAGKAQNHNLMADVIVRFVYFVIQFMLLLIFESKQHFFQYKIMWIIAANGTLLFLSVQMHPLATLILVWVLTHPRFAREEKRLAEGINEAAELDENLWFLFKKAKIAQGPNYTRRDYDRIGSKSNAAPDRRGDKGADEDSDDGEDEKEAEQDQALPVDNVLSQQPSALQKMFDTVWFDFGESIGILLFLITYRKQLTPDFIHFVTCVVEEEADFVCIMGYWCFWKCFLIMDPAKVNKFDAAGKVEERVKLVARAGIEILASLLLAQAIHGAFADFYPWVYCLSVFAFTAVRSIYYEHLDLWFVLFLVTYVTQNFIVNVIDFGYFRHWLGFYSDEAFHRMFSYKVFQAVLCALISFVYSQTISPTFEFVKETPQILSVFFLLTIPCNILMILTFLYELTVYDQHYRATVFETQLAKVFNTTWSVYLLAVIFSHWMQGLSDYSQKFYWEHREFDNRLNQLKREGEELKEKHGYTEGEVKRYINRSLEYQVPERDVIKKRISRFNEAYHSWTEYLDVLREYFDLFIITECAHFAQKSDNQHLEVMRQVQTVSAVIFFMAVHVPLSRMSSYFMFVTALLPMMLNIKTKYWFYEKTNKLVVKVFQHDKEAQNFIQIPNNLRYESDKKQNIAEAANTSNSIYLTKEEASQQENAAFIVVVYLALFFSLLFNYIYTVFLQEIVSDTVGVTTRFLDKAHIEAHFIRYLQLALFDHRPKDVLHDMNVWKDCFWLVVVIVPEFVIGMRFWTAPVYLNYQRRINAFVAPLCLLPIFLATHRDILLLGLLVLYMNFYVFWYHIDPPPNIYQASRHKIRDRRTTNNVRDQMRRRQNLYR